MSRRLSRDIVVLAGVAVVLALFGWYMKVATRRAREEARRRSLASAPPVLALKAKAEYDSAEEVWVEVQLENRSGVRLGALEPIWPGTVDFELGARRKKRPPVSRRPEIIAVAAGSRARRRINLGGIFEFPPGEYELRARYEPARAAPAQRLEDEGVWAEPLVSAPVKLRVGPSPALPKELIEIKE